MRPYHCLRRLEYSSDVRRSRNGRSSGNGRGTGKVISQEQDVGSALRKMLKIAGQPVAVFVMYRRCIQFCIFIIAIGEPYGAGDKPESYVPASPR